jgi:hypothetical protein
MMVIFCGRYFVKRGLSHNFKMSVNQLDDKFTNFLLEGKRSWYETIPDDFISSKVSLNENALLLHKRF